MARGFELGPALPSGINLYVQVLVAFGREQEARDAVARMLATAPADNLTWLTEMFLWALDGRRGDIVATLTEERVRWARADLQYSLQLAEYFAILRENDRAFEWLENAVLCRSRGRDHAWPRARVSPLALYRADRDAEMVSDFGD